MITTQDVFMVHSFFILRFYCSRPIHSGGAPGLSPAAS